MGQHLTKWIPKAPKVTDAPRKTTDIVDPGTVEATSTSIVPATEVLNPIPASPEASSVAQGESTDQAVEKVAGQMESEEISVNQPL